VAAGVLIVFYVLPYVSHLQVPAGDDATFYVGAIRDAGKLGLVDPQVAARPAYPLLGAALGSVSGTSPWLVTAGLPIALVVALGLAGAALASRWGLRGPAMAAFALLAGLSGVAARLVAGKAENLAILALLCALLAILAWSEGRRRWVGIGVVAFAAGLTEWPLMLGFIGIVGLDMVIRLVRRDRESAQRVLPLGVGSVAGFTVALVAIVVASHATLAIEHLPGAARYGPRLRLELRLLWAPLTVVLAALGWWAARRFRRKEVEPLRHLLTLWLVLTGLATLVGALGAPFPSYRVLTFALPVLLASAAAAFVVVRWRPTRGRAVVAVARPVLGVVIAVASVLPAADMWFRGLPAAVSAPAILQMDAAARYAASLPGDQPVVLVLRLKALKFLVYQRVVHDVLPVGDGDRLLVDIGGVQDALAGRPSKAFTPQGQQIVRELFPPIGKALRAGAPILTARDLNPHAFAAAVERGVPTFAGGDVALIRGPAAPAAFAGDPLPLPIQPSAAAGFAALALGMLFVAGIGWGLVLFPRGPPLVVVAMSPALGTAAMSILAFVASRAGVQPNGGAAATELVVAVVASVAAGVAGILTRRRAPSEPPDDHAVTPSDGHPGPGDADAAPVTGPADTTGGAPSDPVAETTVDSTARRPSG
jgi:hypothetical protein